MDIHFTKKDFKLEWFSGTGGGGQHRNKHMNCCRITHIDTGLRAQGTGHRERPANQRDAFTKLANMLLAHFADDPEGRRSSDEVVRLYHGPRNEVVDHASGLRQTYRAVVVKGNIGSMIRARRGSQL
jgi:protein subunit release factor A